MSKNKYLILILILIIPFLISFNSSLECLSLELSGFLIYKIKRKDVENKILNDKLKDENKSYSIAIDYDVEVFFIPSDSISTSLSDNLLSYNINRGDNFFFNVFKNKYYIEELCPSISYSKYESIDIDISNNDYYSLKKDSIFCTK